MIVAGLIGRLVRPRLRQATGDALPRAAAASP